jgi:hypothetical protein
MWVSSGPVLEILPEGRPMLPWSCFRFQSSGLHGMSGGPIFDSRGLVIGTFSAAMDTLDGLGEAYATMLWPALSHIVEAEWPPGMFPQPVSLLDMDPRRCAIIGRGAVRRVPSEPGLVKTTYQVWSDHDDEPSATSHAAVDET